MEGKNDSKAKQVAENLLLNGLQTWGQSKDERVKAWQDIYDFIGMDVLIGICKDNGRVYTFKEKDAELAWAFMKEVNSKFPMGKFEDEREMIMSKIKEFKEKK